MHSFILLTPRAAFALSLLSARSYALRVPFDVERAREERMRAHYACVPLCALPAANSHHGNSLMRIALSSPTRAAQGAV
jgi:hypothetical protein